MSQIEETIERIKSKPGIEGYVICSKKGQVLRRFHTMSEERAGNISSILGVLATKAQSVVRDLDPTNELQYMRIKTKRHEVMMAVDNQFLVIVLQRWAPSNGTMV